MTLEAEAANCHAYGFDEQIETVLGILAGPGAAVSWSANRDRQDGFVQELVHRLRAQPDGAGYASA